jgi:hypothetical protein
MRRKDCEEVTPLPVLCVYSFTLYAMADTLIILLQEYKLAPATRILVNAS